MTLHTPKHFPSRQISGTQAPDQFDQRQLIDEITLLRAASFKMALTQLNLCTASTEEARAPFRAEYLHLQSVFKKNFDLLYDTAPYENQASPTVDWIRRIAALAPERKAALTRIGIELEQSAQKISRGHIPTARQRCEFENTQTPIIMKEITLMVWELWADVEAQKQQAYSQAAQLQATLTTTLSEIMKISSAVRMTALNASILAAGAGTTGAGFAVVAREIKALAETIQDSANSAEKAMDALRL